MHIKDGYKIDDKIITDFEKKFDFSLPKDYVEFILNNNGGEPVEDCFFDFYDNVTEKK